MSFFPFLFIQCLIIYLIICLGACIGYTYQGLQGCYKDKMSVYKDKMSVHKDKMSVYKDKMSVYKDKMSVYKDLYLSL
mgnify:CR=1 FL=1